MSDVEEATLKLIGSIALILTLMFLSNACSASSVENKLGEYKYIVVNGVEYKTSDVSDVDACNHYRSATEYIITLKDGTVIKCVGYTCHN